MNPDTLELIARIRGLHDELLATENDLRIQRTHLREALTLLRLGERPTVVAAILERDDVWVVS